MQLLNNSECGFRCRAGKPINPYQGLKPCDRHSHLYQLFAGKPINPYQGLKLLETKMLLLLLSRKTHKSLSGIETGYGNYNRQTSYAGKPINPYQGLKQYDSLGFWFPGFAGKPINPYQGLKRGSCHSLNCFCSPENP